jgi:O-antigen/teichoic acid export membrane protein
VSTMAAIQMTAALLTMLCTIVLVAGLPAWFGERLGVDIATGQWVVACLGVALSVEMGFDAFRGVITGSHRWDIHNGLNAASHIVTTVTMVTALILTGDLRSLAIVYMLGTFVTEAVRMTVAYRVCPPLHLRPSLVSRADAHDLLAFGGKSMIDAISRLVLFQTNSLVVAAYLGPSALAVYARPNALVRHAETLTNKFAFVLTPAASSLESSGRMDDLKKLVLGSTRAGAAIALPMIVGFAVMGDVIMRVWMGPSYAGNSILLILALGYLLPLITRPAMQVLVGLNLHGWVGITGLVMAATGAALGWLAVGKLDLGLSGAAIAVGLPLAFGKGVFPAVYVCRKVGISAGSALRAVAPPFLCAAPFGAALLAGRYLFGPSPVAALLGGAALGGLVLAPLYWRFILPERLRQKVVRRIPGAARFARTRLVATAADSQ